MTKFEIDESKILISTGYLISTSAHLYINVGTEEIGEKFIWILGLCASKFIFIEVLLAYMMGFFIYLYSKKCTFGLEIAEYILLPLSCFFTIQCMNDFQNEGLHKNKTDTTFIFMIFFAIQIVGLFKIYYLNQTFPAKENQNILRFSIIGRFFRIIKNIIAFSSFMLLPEKDYFTSVILLNCLDFFINSIQITFLKLELEECMCLCNLNNVVSVTVLGFFGFNEIALSFLWTIFLYLCLICLNLGFKNSISSNIIEVKLKFYFQNFKAAPIDFTEFKHKQNLVYLLSCFQSIYSFDKESNKILMKPHAEEKWSKSFLFQIKNMYLFAFMSYLSKLEEQNLKTRRTQNLTTTKQIRKIRSLKTQKSLFQGKGEISLEDAYEKIFGTKMSTQEILENKNAFFSFLGFCMDHIEEKENLKFPWSYSSEFFLTFTMDIGKNFMTKETEICHRRFTLKNESIFYKVRNHAFYNYIKTYQTKYAVGFTLIEKYMLFANEFENLKDEMLLVCEDELKFLKKFTDLTNENLNPFDIEDDLIQRKENKRVIFELLEKCANNEHSINCSDFAVIFLLLMVGIKKSIYQTPNLTNDYFRIPSKRKKKLNEQEKFFENKNLSLQPVLVCNAYRTNDESQIGELTMFNSLFKEKFGINLNDFKITKGKITDLLPLFESKALHDEAMSKKNLFQFENEVKGKNEEFHSEFTCFLKINQEKQYFHVLQSWNVAVRMFYHYQGDVSYVCSLKECSNDAFIFETDFEKLSISQKSIIGLGPNNRYSERQFDLILNLVRVDMDELIMLGLFRNPVLFHNDQQNAMYGENEMGFDLMGEEQKMKKIESSISNEFTSSYKIKFALSIILIFAVQIITLGLIFYGDEKVREAKNLSLEIENFVSGPQSCQIKIAESFYFLKNAYENEFWNYLFSFFIPNFREFMFNQIEECTSFRKTEYFKKYFYYHIQSTPMFNPDKLEEIVPINQLGLSNSSMDYANVIYTMSSTSDWYLSKNLSKLTAEEIPEFYAFIKSMSSPYKESISYKFLNYTIDRNERTIKDIQINYGHVFITFTSISCILFLFAVLFMIWTFLDTYKEYLLLWKLDSSYFDREIRKINFIMKEIQKTRKYEFTKCTFTTPSLFIYQHKNSQESIQVELSVTDFEEKLSENVNDEAILNIPLKNPHSGKVKEIIDGKKYIFGSFAIGFILHICFSVMIWKENEKIVVNGIRINNILGQAGITKMTLTAIELSSWMILLKERSIRPLNETLQIFEESYDFLKHLSFNLMFYDIEDKTILNETLYLSVCEVMSINNLMDTDECEYFLGGLSTIQVSEFLSLITNSFYQLMSRIEIGIIYSIRELGVHFLVNYLFMIPSLIAMIQMIIAKIDVKHHTRIGELQKQYYFIICVFTIFFTIQLLMELKKRRNLKGEILTMDTLDNLNKNEHFKPVLNQLYNSTFS